MNLTAVIHRLRHQNNQQINRFHSKNPALLNRHHRVIEKLRGPEKENKRFSVKTNKQRESKIFRPITLWYYVQQVVLHCIFICFGHGLRFTA